MRFITNKDALKKVKNSDSEDAKYGGEKTGIGELIFAIKWLLQSEKKDDKKDSPTNVMCPFSARKARERLNQDASEKTSWKLMEIQEVVLQKQDLLIFRNLQGTEKGNL